MAAIEPEKPYGYGGEFGPLRANGFKLQVLKLKPCSFGGF